MEEPKSTESFLCTLNEKSMTRELPQFPNATGHKKYQKNVHIFFSKNKQKCLKNRSKKAKEKSDICLKRIPKMSVIFPEKCLEKAEKCPKQGLRKAEEETNICLKNIKKSKTKCPKKFWKNV